MGSKTIRILSIAGSILTSLSCANNPADKVDYSNEPIGMQMLRADPSLKGKRFNTLLDFESPDDLVFVSTQPPAELDSERAHTGKTSADIGSTTKINISGVFVGAFPGDWSLLGAYLWSEHPMTVNLQCTAGSAESHRSVDLPGGKWTPAFVDLMPLQSSSGDATLTITADGPLVCDDVIVFRNDRWFVGAPNTDAPWSIRQQGFKIIGEKPASFNFTLNSVEGDTHGWRIEEVSPMRARFSSLGSTKRLTIYSDGRAYWDGVLKPLSAEVQSDPTYAKEHESPGEVKVADGMGRVNRSTPGDANNDGYNETLGAYQLVATGPRIEFTITPHNAPLLRPIIEIAGLPKGKPLVNVEGQSVESADWLPDGHLLVEIPAHLERETSVSVRIE